jgi:hypothetical protein
MEVPVLDLPPEIRLREVLARPTTAIISVLFMALAFSLGTATSAAAPNDGETALPKGLLTRDQYDALMRKPFCLEGYVPRLHGPLRREGAPPNVEPDSTFIVVELSVPSDGLTIRGWLYLPLGQRKHPLIVLTNGGGNDAVRIKSLSDFIAPVLAHCGIAAFVHDKRGTGRSEGVFVDTTYDEYVRDAGNAALFLSRHARIDSALIGVMGASEGGRIAVLTASRYPIVKFAISMAGTVVSTVDDRLYAQMSGLRAMGVSDSVIAEVKPLWLESFQAWASGRRSDHDRVDQKIIEWSSRYGQSALPAPRAAMLSDPAFAAVLPTWRSLPNDYLSELKHFQKKWLALFGDSDVVVPTETSVRNIREFMKISGNDDYVIAVMPHCGHAPVDTETKRRIAFENIVLNWIDAYVFQLEN